MLGDSFRLNEPWSRSFDEPAMAAFGVPKRFLKFRQQAMLSDMLIVPENGRKPSLLASPRAVEKTVVGTENIKPRAKKG